LLRVIIGVHCLKCLYKQAAIRDNLSHHADILEQFNMHNYGKD